MLLAHGHPWQAFAATGAAAIGLVRTKAVRGAFMLLAVTQASYLLGDWHRADNHQYLLLYWYVAMAVSALAAEGTRELAVRDNARALLALVMAVAAAEKVASNEYVSGRFFLLAFLVDDRFILLDRLLGAAVASARSANAASVAALLDDPTVGAIGLRGGPPVLVALARLLACLSIGVEAFVAGAFALALRVQAAATPALVALLAFVVGTYSLASVPGFGALLCLLGSAATRAAQGRLQLAFAIAAAYVVCCEGLLAHAG